MENKKESGPRPSKKPETQLKEDVTKLPCGCIYKDKDWMLVRVHECDHHKRKRKTKRPKRPKAECVRP